MEADGRGGGTSQAGSGAMIPWDTGTNGVPPEKHRSIRRCNTKIYILHDKKYALEIE